MHIANDSEDIIQSVKMMVVEKEQRKGKERVSMKSREIRSMKESWDKKETA